VAVAPCPTPIFQFFDNAGRPANGGSVLTQVGGFNYPTYQDSTGTTPLPNPIPLNSRGEVSNAAGNSCQLFLAQNQAYTFTLYDNNGNVLNQSTYVNGQAVTAAQVAALSTNAAVLSSLQITDAEIAANITPTSYAYFTWDVRRLGVVGDNITDDTAALQRCYTVGGDWKIPSGFQIRCTSTIVGIIGTRLYSDTAGGIGLGTLSTLPQAYLVHDFNGTFFDLVGSPSSNLVGGGFTFDRLTFVQKDGSGTGASGICIRSVQVSNTQKCAWIRMSDCNIETLSGGSNDWTWGIYLDGTAAVPNNNLRDHFFQRMRIVSGANASGSINLLGQANVFMMAVECNLSFGNLNISGVPATLSSSIEIVGCSFNNVILDQCQVIYGAGNSCATVTMTSNTQNIELGISCTGTAPVLAGTRVTLHGFNGSNGKYTIWSNNNVRFDTAANPVEIAQVLSVGSAPALTGDVRLNNSSVIAARNSANSGDVQALSVDNSNRVRLAPGGSDDIVWGRAPVSMGGGAGAVLGTIGGSGPTSGAQFEWLQVFNTSGDKCFIPIWK
jgi:hypothetical protein